VGLSRCDGKPEFVDGWDALAKQAQRLEEEEEEAMAKILRLRKQKKFVLRRQNDMMARNIRTLEEYDALVEKEKKEEVERKRQEGVEVEVARLAALPTPENDPFFDPGQPSGPAFLDPSFDPGPAFWADLGIGGGTPRASQGS
jgi:hypothetical protein